ncbi:unnamed protein product [Callosobruchus maculatus]|uniref:DUF2496 domain-containing protein n=1 Tax=Callosobruchus maculatus TaxID=64391 RepID=A0A653BEG9_CALMS|nr:unnamed protein product [Callosobruchus maculatus]
MSLENAPDEVKLAVDLIMLLENHEIPAETVLKALEIVRRDFEGKIGAVGHPKSDHHAGGGVRERPVDQTLGHKGFVRDDHLFAIEVGDGGRTNTDLADGPGEGADGDGIANTHRTFEQDYQARHKVTENLLQAEAQAHRQRGRQPLELIPRDAERAEYRHRPNDDNDVIEDGGNGIRRPLAQVQP